MIRDVQRKSKAKLVMVNDHSSWLNVIWDCQRSLGLDGVDFDTLLAAIRNKQTLML